MARVPPRPRAHTRGRQRRAQRRAQTHRDMVVDASPPTEQAAVCTCVCADHPNYNYSPPDRPKRQGSLLFAPLCSSLLLLPCGPSDPSALHGSNQRASV
mmetsp:Transcript_67470/g.150595  ORF Transcript_67470/g.150595 Transcript_67470/m.150595 type:complete len:99 (+) Transcript_67470:297-593(+)